MKLAKKVTVNTISNQVYNLLKENIINLALEPGTSISEKEIAEKLGVSRTPVREAFVRLEQEDLLEIFPQKGTRISLINFKEVEDALFIREHLEKATLRVACKKIQDEHINLLRQNIDQQIKSIQVKDFDKFFKLDEEFHYILVSISGNNKVWQAIQRVDAHLKRTRMLTLFTQEKSQIVINEHKEILDALERKDELKAIQILEQHVMRLNVEEESLKQKFPHYFSNSELVLDKG